MEMRRKHLMFAAAAAFALSIGAGGCSGEKAPSPPRPAKGDPVGMMAAPKIRVKWFSGTIEAVDASAGTLTLKGPKGEREFRADGKAKQDLAGLKVGDKVIVKHSGETAHSVVKPSANHPPRLSLSLVAIH
jgi:hypothetical protein